jgi:folate-dependent phosphoribosylglycinamide formyltransferase PurN
VKVVTVTGNGARHASIAAALARAGLLAGRVIQAREPSVPPPPSGLSPGLTRLFGLHFGERERVETAFFGRWLGGDFGVPSLHVTREELNGPKVWSFVERLRADVALSYGVQKLDAATLERLPQVRWNVHGGLSPWYRGVATHFWPSYLLEPQMTGVTLHELTHALDGGPVVHQTAGPLVAGDGIHELACRTVELFGAELPRVFELLARGDLRPATAQRASGKLWLDRDFRPEHLRLVYETYENRVVDAYLRGDISPREPSLIRQF